MKYTVTVTLDGRVLLWIDRLCLELDRDALAALLALLTEAQTYALRVNP